MPPYLDNKTLPTPTRYLTFIFSITSFIVIEINVFIFIENECLTDVIWDLKRVKKLKQREFDKSGLEPGSITSSDYGMHFTIYATEAVVYQ